MCVCLYKKRRTADYEAGQLHLSGKRDGFIHKAKKLLLLKNLKLSYAQYLRPKHLVFGQFVDSPGQFERCY